MNISCDVIRYRITDHFQNVESSITYINMWIGGSYLKQSNWNTKVTQSMMAHRNCLEDEVETESLIQV